MEVRYVEVLLWKAEILIQFGRHQEALPIINQIKERAANSTQKLKLPNGELPVSYTASPYIEGVKLRMGLRFCMAGFNMGEPT